MSYLQYSYLHFSDFLNAILKRVGLSCGIQASRRMWDQCLRGSLRGVFLRDLNPYLNEFRKKTTENFVEWLC